MSKARDKDQQHFWHHETEKIQNCVSVYVCVSLQAAEMVEDEVDPDSHSWGGMRGEGGLFFFFCSGLR